MGNIDKYEDLLDVRDIIARVEELRATWEETTGDSFDDYTLSTDDLQVGGLDEDEAEELEKLTELLEELKGQGGDHEWRGDWYPVTLIRDTYFVTYAQDLAEDIGAIDADATWPNDYIDWVRAARALQIDYTSVEFDGITYWTR